MSSVPATGSPGRADALERTRQRLGPLFRQNQVLGRRNAIGCVALEITQRCNLDCTLCYLSENSERVKDVPLAEVFRRIDSTRSPRILAPPRPCRLPAGTRLSGSAGSSWRLCGASASEASCRP